MSGCIMPAGLDKLIPANAPASELVTAMERAAVGKERLVLVRDGKPLAAIVPIEDLDALEAEDAHDINEGLEALADFERDGANWTTQSELAARFGIKL
jgi:antitoxin (DNA-binding transcriptional repressor) of toxin-antitoxin stability system